MKELLIFALCIAIFASPPLLVALMDRLLEKLEARLKQNNEETKTTDNETDSPASGGRFNNDDNQ